jgi:hypothetical protein
LVEKILGGEMHPLANIIKAYVDGIDIEFKPKRGDTWFLLQIHGDRLPLFDNSLYDYRIRT